jgi:lysophospholipase L1-like esterase
MNTKIDLHRFDDQLKQLDEHMRVCPPRKHGILLYGSSTMANWRENDMCYNQLVPLPIENTGFGGSTAEEALYYYHRLVVPFEPSVMAYYEGANDLMNGYTPDEVLMLTHRLFEWSRQDFPGIKFLIVPIKLSPALDHIREQGNICNRMFEEYAATHEDTSVLDVNSFLYDDAGNHRREIYVEDMLHHNERGYAEFAELMKPTLEKLYD